MFHVSGHIISMTEDGIVAFVCVWFRLRHYAYSTTTHDSLSLYENVISQSMVQQKGIYHVLLAVAITTSPSLGFVTIIPSITSDRFTNDVTRTSTELAFGIPSFFTPNNNNDDDNNNGKNKLNSNKNKKDDKNSIKEVEEKKIGVKALLQLIAAGAGAPFLGDFEGVDKETGKFMFSLEANNLVDENGQSKQTQMPYFENGWVDEDDPGFQWPWEKKK
jgi:hypothetical protein